MLLLKIATIITKLEFHFISVLKYKFHFTTVIAQQNRRWAAALAFHTMRREHDDHRKLYWRADRYQQQQ